MLISRISNQESVTPNEVLNLLTGRWIKTNGKLFQKLIREGYRCANRLSDYLEDIGTISVGEFELDPLADFYHPALIPPLSTLAERADIRENFIISVESVVVGGELLGSEREETKAWRDDLLVKFLHHSNLAPAKYRPEALYDADLEEAGGLFNQSDHS
ncbi:16479_t:CDS:2 [Acaulospora colombiana]|uniref:16479_t:CDS:1 n=1 Tax=Acaulospora colombiana TaxID=27376 RepID=A0ACA9KM70_9GLOM|nr:16479_t:CDS:2 [Acaulospora colombiana]